MDRYYVIGTDVSGELQYISGYSNGKTFYSNNIEEAIDFTAWEAKQKLAGAAGFGVCYYVTREDNKIIDRKNVTKKLTPEIVDGTWIDRHYVRNTNGDQVADAISCGMKHEAEAVKHSDFDRWEVTK
jgi:hypothetical protein